MKYKIKQDCVHFNGEIPCKYHKQFSKTCPCEYYLKAGKRILIIKLGAVGDVIRTTPLLRRLKKVYPNCEITWVSRTPEILPAMVDVPIGLASQDILGLMADKFDLLLNLDKEKPACALAKLVKAKIKKGFTLRNGKCAPLNKEAEHKFLTGLDDGLNRANRLAYPEEIFKLAGLDFRYGWSYLDNYFILVGLVFVAASTVLLNWAMVVNPHFEPSVRIQKERNHRVITSGPYHFVRHPGYLAGICFAISMPLLIGSLFAFIAVGIYVSLMVSRTWLEDKTLQEELEGYSEYTSQVRYRLVPRVW